MMESKKSKKARPSGDFTKAAANLNRLSTTSTTLVSRHPPKERVKSISQLPQETQKLRQSLQSTPEHLTNANPKPAAHASSSVDARKPHSSWNGSSTGESSKLGGEFQEVVIAVLGGGSVGKSTFLQLALDLKKSPSSPFASKKVSLEGLISVIRLVEVDVEDVEVVDESLRWPTSIGDQPTPAIDGALLMFNVLDPGSATLLPPLLNALCKDQVPAIMVASHCDSPPKTWKVDYEKIEKLCMRFKGIECFQTFLDISETHKRCVSVILRNVMLDRRVAPVEPQPQQVSRATLVAPQRTSQPPNPISSEEHRRRGRAMSESLTSATQPSRWSKRDLVPPSISNIEHEDSVERSASAEDSHSDQEDEQRSRLKAEAVPKYPKSSPASPLLGSEQRTFKHTAMHERSKSDNASDKGTLKGSGKRIKSTDGSADDHKDDGGVAFNNLIDRLLIQPMSKADSNFAAIFLCLYRKFAAPSEVLSAVIQRFEEASAMDVPMLIRLSSQLRYLAILRDWVADYPGDFAHPLTRRMVSSFVQSISNNSAFAVAHKEISQHLEVVCEDDDTEWACSDKSRSRASTMESFLTKSSAHSATSTLTADSSTEDILDHTATEKELARKTTRISSTSSGSSSIDRSTTQSNGSAHISLQSVEHAQRQAQMLNPIPRVALDKIRWHQMMDIPDEQIARELTRIDWILYSSIRPRDLVRHISLSTEQKESCKSLEHVNRMINQFNHVAFWVAHWILLRDKPKHRAKALEKFMGIAWKLRYLNNYNSLGAVIAGINGTAVHRLSQTRDLISAEAQKQFMRLEILMGTQKSHFAYRLAWENTSTPRIPFLPLHRRDLVFAEEANRTFIPDAEAELINWKKFEVMGQVIVEIRKSQQLPYSSIKRNEEVQRLLLDGAFSKEDDELYERSIQLEKPGAGEAPRKKFALFQR